jgi:hypothetical protein
MRIRRACLFLFVLLPGLAAVATCGHYLFHDWSALISAFARFEKVSASGADIRSVYIAGTLDSIYRINAFADGVGVMLGAVLFGMGVHGLCTLAPVAAPEKRHVRLKEALPSLAAAPLAVVITFGVLAELARRVGSTNDLRRAVIREDTPKVRELMGEGADPTDRLWWGASALEVAREQVGPRHAELLSALDDGRSRDQARNRARVPEAGVDRCY